MAIIDRPRGLRPRRTLRGQVDFNQVVVPTSALNAETIMIGDPVTIDANGHVQKWPHGAITAASTNIAGVALNVFGDDRKPFTHNQPTTGPLIPPTTNGFVGVCMDPDVIYTAQYDTSLGQSDVFGFVHTTAGSGVTALGQSGIEMAGASTASASQGAPFLIIGLADDLDPAAANNDIEVRIVAGRHQTNKFSGV